MISMRRWASSAAAGGLLLATALVSLHVGMTDAARAAPAAAPNAQRQRPGPNNGACVGTVTATLSTNPVSICDRVTVTARVEPICPVCPDGVNVVFVHIDAPQSSWQFRESIRALEEMERLVPPGSKLNAAVVLYNNSGSTTVLKMTDDIGRVRGALNRARNTYNPLGMAEEAAQQAVQELRRSRGRNENPCEFVIFFAYTKSHIQVMRDRLLKAAQMIHSEDVTLMVGCPIDPGAWYCRGPEPEMPRSQRWFTKYSEANKLQGMVRDEMRTYQRGVKVRGLQLTQDIPAGLTYIDGSATGDPAIAPLTYGPGTRLTWGWDDAEAGVPVTVTYGLDPDVLSTYVIKGEMTVTDSTYRKQVLPAPELSVEVVDLCPTATPTPTATDTPTSTATDTPTPTDTATGTPTSTPTPLPTPTATPSIFRIYLPLLPWEKCVSESIYADAVLVLDMSTSMYRPTRGGRSKHAAAIEAARTFVDQFDFSPDEQGGRDQVGVVGFNGAAWTAAALTSDRAAIDAALGGLEARIAQGTRLDLAFSHGQGVLDAGPRLRGNRQVVIVLTDGLPNQVPVPPGGRQEDTVLAAASAVKGAGSRVFTIGLGEPDDVLRELLTASASSESDYYFVPDGEDLTGIYRQIAGRITECPR